jgi:hypothetical protein
VDGSGRSEGRIRSDRLTIGEAMLIVAGLGLGLWLILFELREVDRFPDYDAILLFLVMSLGGLAFVGPPLLLWERRRDRRTWGAGKVLWFSTGGAAWLLWPPVIARRVRGDHFEATTSGACFAYGTPLMALYLTLALLAGGWLGRRGRRRARRSWRETFGLLLGLAWACTGLYVLYLLYREDFQR